MPAYVAFCGSVQVTEHTITSKEDGKRLVLRTDTLIQADDHRLDATFESWDVDGVHEMLRSFMGQRIRITVEVE